jgi:hypothetical protein
MRFFLLEPRISASVKLLSDCQWRPPRITHCTGEDIRTDDHSEATTIKKHSWERACTCPRSQKDDLCNTLKKAPFFFFILPPQLKVRPEDWHRRRLRRRPALLLLQITSRSKSPTFAAAAAAAAAGRRRRRRRTGGRANGSGPRHPPPGNEGFRIPKRALSRRWCGAERVARQQQAQWRKGRVIAGIFKLISLAPIKSRRQDYL